MASIKFDQFIMIGLCIDELVDSVSADIYPKASTLNGAKKFSLDHLQMISTLIN